MRVNPLFKRGDAFCAQFTTSSLVSKGRIRKAIAYHPGTRLKSGLDDLF